MIQMLPLFAPLPGKIRSLLQFTLLVIGITLTTLRLPGQDLILKASQNFDQPVSNIPHGKIDSVKYKSATVGTTRKALVYTPPGYSKKQRYPVLYLLHGIGGDEKEWLNGGSPQVILDNLYAAGQVQPMIVVMPNGRAMKDDRATGNIMGADKVKAFVAKKISLMPTAKS